MKHSKPNVIDKQVLASDIAASVAYKQQHRALEFMRQAHSLHGTLLNKSIDHLARCLFRWEGAGAQTVDSYIVTSPVHGQMTGHVDNTTLERVVLNRAGITHAFVCIGVGTDNTVHGSNHQDRCRSLPFDGMVT